MRAENPIKQRNKMIKCEISKIERDKEINKKRLQMLKKIYLNEVILKETK